MQQYFASETFIVHMDVELILTPSVPSWFKWFTRK